MPYKDPETRKKFMKEYYLKNSTKIKKTSKETRERLSSENPNHYSEMYEAYKDGDKERKYLKRYGISPEDYQRMFEEQNGSCKICNRHQSTLKKALAVDHNHRTGKIRGLLCPNCNTSIGKLGDTAANVMRAVVYLQENDSE